MTRMLDVSELKKSYGRIEAVRGISFYVETGKLFAFLGPNGAGKSTTINILCTLLRPDQGSVSIDGHQLGRDDAAIRNKIGVVFQDNLLDPLLSVRENLFTRGRFYGLQASALHAACDFAAEVTGVQDFLNRPYGRLSGGQRRRADIARALVNTPQLLFLDEPTTGLDPQTRSSIWQTIRDLQVKHQMTVFLTTHYMEEAAGADYVMVIDDGLIAARGTPDELRQRYSQDHLRLISNCPDELAATLTRYQVSFDRKESLFKIALTHTLDALPLLEQVKDLIINFEVQNGTMDDAFIAITGKEIRE